MVRSKYIKFVVILMLQSSICVSYAAIHHQMTKDELQSTFHVDDHELVPEYEIVDIHHIKEETKYRKLLNSLNGVNKRKKINLKAFGKEINLTMTLNDRLINKDKFKLQTMRLNATAENGIQYVDETSKINFEEFGELYEDEVNQAAILLKSHNNSLIVEGSIGSELEISPIPNRLLEKTAVNDNLLRPQKHIVYKRIPDYSKYGQQFDYIKMKQDKYLSLHQNNVNSRNKRDIPTKIYIEIKLVLDCDMIQQLHPKFNALAKYLAMFWSRVNLVYKKIQEPKISLSIVDVVLILGESVKLDTLNKSRLPNNLMNAEKALKELREYLYMKDMPINGSKKLPYDVAFIMTRHDLCFPNNNKFTCSESILGAAYQSVICFNVDDVGRIFQPVGIFKDFGYKDISVTVASHELGHILGIHHDKKTESSDDMYIMYPTVNDLKQEWSEASLEDFKSLATSKHIDCLRDDPKESVLDYNDIE